MKVIIVGGVAGGATAAARLRRNDENAEIIIFERTGYISYANCGLPYYIGGVITDRRALTLQTPESFGRRFNVDVRVRREVTDIDTERKTVKVRELNGGREYEESYDKLLLSPGAKAAVPPVPGAGGDRTFTLRTVEDTFAIYDFAGKTDAKKAVIAGGGFIGLETAENLMRRGIAVTLLQRGTHVMPPFDGDMAEVLHAYLRAQGLDLRPGVNVAAFEADGGGITIRTDCGDVRADFAVIATGVAPDTELAVRAGLKTGIRGAIVVSGRMETSAPDVYAVGDAVQVTEFVGGRDALISLAGPANKQGRIAADNMTGGHAEYKGSQGSSVIKLFGMTAACTGLNEKTAAAAGIACDKVVIAPASHATYYPGAEDMFLKLLFGTDGRVLGAQIAGGEGVDKRIDVIATAIRARMTVRDLAELDLAYAPPYSSAKDPVNMAGFVAGNVLDGKVRQYHWHDVPALSGRKDITMLDVRTRGEYARGRIAGTVNIPLDELRSRLDELDRAKPVYVNCHSGLRSYIACRILTAHGFDCYNLSGGYGFFRYASAGAEYGGGQTYPCGMPKE